MFKFKNRIAPPLLEKVFQIANLNGGIHKVRLSWRGKRSLKKWMKTNRGEGVKPICMLALWKRVAWFFKQQTEFFLISCFAVAKSFAVLSLVQHIKVFFLKKDLLLKRCRHFLSVNVFLWTYKYFCRGCIYNCVRNIDRLCWDNKKNNNFLPFHLPTFHSKTHKQRERGR